MVCPNTVPLSREVCSPGDHRHRGPRWSLSPMTWLPLGDWVVCAAVPFMEEAHHEEVGRLSTPWDGLILWFSCHWWQVSIDLTAARLWHQMWIDHCVTCTGHNTVLIAQGVTGDHAHIYKISLMILIKSNKKSINTWNYFSWKSSLTLGGFHESLDCVFFFSPNIVSFLGSSKKGEL